MRDAELRLGCGFVPTGVGGLPRDRRRMIRMGDWCFQGLRSGDEGQDQTKKGMMAMKEAFKRSDISCSRTVSDVIPLLTRATR
jgi:hypothetical protein